MTREQLADELMTHALQLQAGEMDRGVFRETVLVALERAQGASPASDDPWRVIEGDSHVIVPLIAWQALQEHMRQREDDIAGQRQITEARSREAGVMRDTIIALINELQGALTAAARQAGAPQQKGNGDDQLLSSARG